MSPDNNPFGNVKLHGFHGNPSCDFKEWGVPTKHSAATRHKMLNGVKLTQRHTTFIYLLVGYANYLI